MKFKLDNGLKKLFLVVVVLSLFFAAVMQVSSQRVKYSDLEKIELDPEEAELLKVYYGELLDIVGKDTTFNTIATKESLAVLNVTIDGRDRRILTRLRTGYLFPPQDDITNAKLVRTENLIVLGNISLKGVLFSENDKLYGPRSLYGLGSTSLRYVDEGFSRIVDGKANVSINPVLRDLISSYNVFLSAEGLTRGIYIAEKTDSYFVVKSVNPSSRIGFSWMLRGLRRDYDLGNLFSGYGVEKGISITATISYENGSTRINIGGLDKIFALINETITPININETNNNEINETNNNKSNNGITLVTGNLIDEFGLETDLGKILADSGTLPTTTGENNEQNNNEILDSNNNLITENDVQTNNNEIINDSIINNETVSESEEVSDLEFTLYSVDENFIVSQIADVTGLSLGQVRQLINFVYSEPEGFEDEILEGAQGLDFIEKVDGSVIIKLG